MSEQDFGYQQEQFRSKMNQGFIDYITRSNPKADSAFEFFKQFAEHMQVNLDGAFLAWRYVASSQYRDSYRIHLTNDYVTEYGFLHDDDNFIGGYLQYLKDNSHELGLIVLKEISVLNDTKNDHIVSVFND